MRGLAVLLLRYRLRHGWNALRARPTGAPGFVVVLAVGSAAAYVALVAAALKVIGRTTGVSGQVTALTLMAGAIALAGMTAKASGGDAVLAGSPENEFLLARPVSMPRLVAARTLVSLVVDPFGTLFLMPILLAAAIIWRLPASACVVAVAISVCAQVTIASTAQAIQIGVVRWVPRRRRSLAWVVLRVTAALALGSVWISATSILRAPERLAPHLKDVERWLAFTPTPSLVAPLVAFLRKGPGGTLRAASVALLPLVVIAVGAGALAVFAAHRAGLHGWEEAGAPWAEAATATATPAARRARARAPLTLGRREWRMLMRDRPRITALIVLPAILAGVQIFGPIGWDTATATLDRIAVLTFSVTLYMTTLGPLPHMQAERRAFWILRAAPVSVARIMAVKAAIWSAILAGFSVTMFAALLLGGALGDNPFAEILRVGALVVVGAVGMTILAVALGCLAADLSNDQRSAIGPGTVYLFLFLGGLFNLLLGLPGWQVLVPLGLYLALTLSYWHAGIAHARVCLDAAAVWERRHHFRMVDAVTLLLFAYLGPVAVGRGFTGVGAPPRAIAVGQWVVRGAVAFVAACLIARSWRARHRRPRRD